MDSRAMFREIGSNFWLKPEEMEVREAIDWQHCYIKKGEHAVYTSSGRGAISLILAQIKPARRVVLLPLYTCASVLMPFVKQDYEIQFYDQQLDLGNDDHEFMEAVEKIKPGIVFLNAYFGFDTLANLRPLYRWLREQGIIVIEDITHALFSTFPKTGADYYIASLRKWFALPDGGVAISTEKSLHAGKLQIHEELVQVNLKAIAMKNEYTGSLDGKLKTEYRKLFYSTEAMLNDDCGVYAMSSVAHGILAKTDFHTLASVRRENFKYLLSRIEKSPLLTPVFGNLPEGIVPLYFPVYVPGDRDKLRAFLAEAEIYAPVHWEIPNKCLNQLTDSTSCIYSNILSIPCDQRYSCTDFNRIFLKLSEYIE
jgi:dTDP-4-amino-4,6-dideoxygalactose transaminase